MTQTDPPKKTLADAMRNAAANSMIPDEDIDFILRTRTPPPPTALDLQLRAELLGSTATEDLPPTMDPVDPAQ